jgi:DNA repair exonuclease SbcCD ATPase subunit
MKDPNEFQLNQLAHAYDSAYARQYYLRTRQLKGRKRGQAEPARSTQKRGTPSRDPRSGKSVERIHREATAKQKQELGAQISRLQDKLGKLETLIRKKEHAEASENRKAKAKQERAQKESDKPKTAAEKAEAARENKKYRDRNKQKLKQDQKDDSAKSGDKEKKDKKSGSGPSVSDLKTLATKVRGQISVAKQKLAAL